MAVTQCRILCPAKINLGLRILFKREDGFHELETIMVAIDLYDELVFTRSARPGVHLTLESAPHGERDRAAFPLDERNLIAKAVQIVANEHGIEPAVSISVHKRIPIAAGLGGGSSNAAAAVMAMTLLHELSIESAQLQLMAARLGSDVPFFLNGPCAVARGRGEILEEIGLFRDWWCVLMSPPIHLSTADVYSQLNLTSLNHKNSFNMCDDEEGFFTALRRWGNDLAVVAHSRIPELSALESQLWMAGAEGVFVSGSGPTVVGVFRKQPNAETVRTLQERNEGVQVLVSRPVDTATALIVR